MGVYIKGMEMPRNCWECEFNKSTLDRMDFCTLTNKQYNWGLSERPSDCPLVSVPPHGRLIDLDGTALAQYYDEEHEEWSMETVTVEDILWGVCENMPPIVIPADKDGET